MIDKRAVRVVVRGLVQGVGYRAFAERAGRESGVVGWVRNRADGSVEAHVEGPSAAVEGMIEKLETGPRSGKVESVDREPVPPAGFASFAIRSSH